MRAALGPPVPDVFQSGRDRGLTQANDDRYCDGLIGMKLAQYCVPIENRRPNCWCVMALGRNLAMKRRGEDTNPRGQMPTLMVSQTDQRFQ